MKNTQNVKLNSNELYQNVLAIILYYLKKQYVLHETINLGSKTEYIFKKNENSFFNIHLNIGSIDNNNITLKINHDSISLSQHIKYLKKNILLEIHYDAIHKFNVEHLSGNDSHSILIPSNNIPVLNTAFDRYKFFEDNYQSVVSFIDDICGYSEYKDVYKYTSNTFYKFKKLSKIMNFDINYIINNVDNTEYKQLVEFLHKYNTDNNDIDKIQFKNLRIIRKHSKPRTPDVGLQIYFGNDLIFHDYETLCFKYLKHPGLCFVLYIIGKEIELRNKYNKDRLVNI